MAQERFCSRKITRCYGTLVDNLSHESDVTSLQDPFTSRPYKTPFYFTIVFPIQSEEAFSNPCRIFAIFSTLSLCACILRHRVEDYVSLLLCQAVGAASRDIEILVVARPNSIICCFCGILQFPAIFSFNALPWFDAAPTAWYKRVQFRGNKGYKLAFISQLVFPGTRTKLQTCPLNVD